MKHPAAHRASFLTLCLLGLRLFAADLLCGSWNLCWFPSGRAEHRASPRVEVANVADAAEAIAAGLRQTPSPKVILFLQELRDQAACTNLVARIGVTNLTTASVSAFRERDRRLAWQQCAIVTTLPVLESSWSYWKHAQRVFPPRGYAYAVLDAGEQGPVACFCVHLKSNYGAIREETRQLNRRKREIAVAQLVETARHIRLADGRGVTHILIAGDFNTDPFSPAFRGEETCSLLTRAGFTNCFEGLPLERRGTHPGTRRYPDSTLDFIFHRGFAEPGPVSLAPTVPLSDHRMVWLTLR